MKIIKGPGKATPGGVGKRFDDDEEDDEGDADTEEEELQAMSFPGLKVHPDYLAPSLVTPVPKGSIDATKTR